VQIFKAFKKIKIEYEDVRCHLQ